MIWGRLLGAVSFGGSACVSLSGARLPYPTDPHFASPWLLSLPVWGVI